MNKIKISEIKTEVEFRYTGQAKRFREFIVKNKLLDAITVSGMTDAEIEDFANERYVALVSLDDDRKETIYLFEKDNEDEVVVISR